MVGVGRDGKLNGCDIDDGNLDCTVEDGENSAEKGNGADGSVGVVVYGKEVGIVGNVDTAGGTGEAGNGDVVGMLDKDRMDEDVGKTGAEKNWRSQVGACWGKG